jgi:L-ascorbate metabolism protein UlaG (beta-lactamase superfamily)
MMNARRVDVTWLGHSTFQFVTTNQNVVIIDPWLMSNPACPDRLRSPQRVDILLLTHGHFDHIGDAVQLAKVHSPEIVGIYELCHWLGSKGIENTLPMNKGGSQQVKDLRLTMTHADHSCGILDGETILYGGEAVGYVIEFPGGLKVYHAGDTNLFSDMKLIAELYQPDVAMLPIGDLFTMSPREAALACQFLGVKKVIPMHYGTFPALTGTPQQLRDLTRNLHGLEIVAMQPGETLQL